MKKIITILGARPQFIKAATVSRLIRENKNLNEILVHTGQHFDQNMSDIFFDEMDIPRPNYNLEINSLGHGAMTGRMLEKIESILLTENPDIVLVYGDTNTTLAGALSAKKLGIQLAHIEAGLRSFNMNMPEEVNRILTDRISDYLFCPTETAVHNLEKEGFKNFNCHIYNVGDVMYDAVLFYEKKSDLTSQIINKLKLQGEKFILCTVHRQENTNSKENLIALFNALNEINQTTRVILPMHPRTRKILAQCDIHPQITIIDPVGYLDIIQLIKHSMLVMTDSGGMQKEAYFFGKYCITLRNETEWVELVENGVNFLTGTSRDNIISAIEKTQQPFTPKHTLYGNGQASKRIVAELLG
jgi:UDP-GlcNAc3NAcA epimerase